MTDDPHTSPSSDDQPGGDDQKGAVRADDLDNLLAEASALADEVAQEVGALNNPAYADPLDIAADPEAELDQDVDKKLAELDGLIEKTQEEIGAPPAQTPATADANVPLDSLPDSSVEQTSASKPDSPAEPDSPSQKEVVESDPAAASDPFGELDSEQDGVSASPEIPDFMAEFTEPEASPEEPPLKAEGREESDTSPTEDDSERAVPDFMAEFTEPVPEPVEPPADAPAAEADDAGMPENLSEKAKLGRVSSADLSARNKQSESAGAAESNVQPILAAPGIDGGLPDLQPLDDPFGSADETPDTTAETDSAATVNPAVKIMRLARTSVSAALWHACSFGIRGLEETDKRLNFLSHRVKQLIGIFAVATTATAVVAYLVSMF